MIWDILIYVLSGLMILLGGLGSVLPVLPGQPLSFAGLWLFAWWTHYETVTPTVLVIFAILTAITMIVDFIAPALGARGYKASRAGAMGSMIGAFLGIFIFGPIGIIVGPFVGGFLGELLNAKDYKQAGHVALGSLIGFIIGSLFKLAVIMGMFVYFVYALF